MNIVYSKKNFHVYRVENQFIVYNTKKVFKAGHTHLYSLNSAKYVLDCALYKDIPHDLDIYRLTSLVRLSTDEDYIRKVEELLEVKKEKKRANKDCPYYNSKAVRKQRSQYKK